MSKSSKKKSFSLLTSILTFFFVGANMATILLLWLCCGSTYVSPELIPKLSLIQLFFPLILLANLAFIIFWLLFKVRWIWLPLVGVGCCITFVLSYCPVHFSADKPSDEKIHVLSFNTRYWGGNEAKKDDGTNYVVEFVENFDAEIICLQEAALSGVASKLKDSMEARGYECYAKEAQVIFSRFPIIASDTLCLPTRTNGGVWAKVKKGTDTIFVINYHFESNHLTQDLKENYTDALESYRGDSIQQELLPLLKLISVAAPFRAKQVDGIAKMIEEWVPKPIIICGDFNDTPISYTLTKLTQNLTSAYTQSGNGLGFTFQEKGFPIRIDHILFSPEKWESCNTAVIDSVKYSDHLPIYTELVPKSLK